MGAIVREHSLLYRSNPGSPNSYSYRDTNSHVDRDPNQHADYHPNGDRDGYPYTNRDADADTNKHSNRDPHTNEHTDRNVHINTNGDLDTDGYRDTDTTSTRAVRTMRRPAVGWFDAGILRMRQQRAGYLEGTGWNTQQLQPWRGRCRATNRVHEGGR